MRVVGGATERVALLPLEPNGFRVEGCFLALDRARVCDGGGGGGGGVAFEFGGGEGIRRTKRGFGLRGVRGDALDGGDVQPDATREGGEDVTLEVKLNAKLRNAQPRASR